MIGHTGVSCRLAGIKIFDLKFGLHGTHFFEVCEQRFKVPKNSKRKFDIEKICSTNMQNFL
jgi:hypothetical protein